MNENRRVTKAAGIIGTATLLSRILGFIRDMLIAWFFGAGLITDAFFVAFRIPNLLRRLFAEGTLSIVFVPVFTDYLAREGREEAFRMARSAVRMLSVILVILTIAGIAGAPLIVRAIAPGFDGPHFHTTVLLTRIMFPYMFFICLVALAMGILNVLGHFTAPAFSPVLLNLAIIGSVLFLSPRMTSPVNGLAIGVLLGGMLQLALQIPFMIRKGFYFWQSARIYHPGLKRIGKLMGPAVLGAAAYQINILVSTLLASMLPEGSVSYLYYADRLIQFPLGLFAISTSVAVLPSLSRQAAARDFKGLGDTFAFSIGMISFITLPSMIGLIVLREPIVAVIFGRGAFGAEDIRMTAHALLFYGVGLWAFSAVRIVVAAFYAIQDTRTPVRAANISIAANVVLGMALMGPLGHGGLALATSIASLINLGLLSLALRRKLGIFPWKKIVVSISKSMISSLIMGVFLLWWIHRIPSIGCGMTPDLIFHVIYAIIVGIVIYSMSALVLQRNEFKAVIALVNRH